MKPIRQLLYLCAALVFAASIANASCRARFHQVTGLSCVTSRFVQTHWEANSVEACSMLCANTAHCQAFSVSDGPCQLFVFHRCSKGVRDCSCNRTAQLFVRQQPGLPPGALCPAGYADDLCGTKYAFVSCAGNWTRCKEMCDAESGLVIMADLMDVEERNKVGQLAANKLAILNTHEYASIYVGGWQVAGSSEPSGGWQWASCGLNISAELWATGEPNDSESVEDRAGFNKRAEFVDLPKEGWNLLVGGFCECVSPFN